MSVKPCKRCGKDCRGRPGVESEPGVYVCSACLEPGEAEGIGPLDAAEPVVQAAPTRDCPACGGAVPIAAIRCAHCEWDLSTIAVKPKAGPKRCPNCGFDRAGWDGRRCPKCKKKVEHEDITERMGEESARLAKREWTRVFACVFGGVVTAALIAGLADTTDTFAQVALGYALTTPVAWLGLLLAVMIWLPVDLPLGLSLGKVASVYALHMPVQILMDLVPMPYIPFAVVFLSYIAIVMWQFELEWPDATYLTILIAVETAFVFLLLQSLL